MLMFIIIVLAILLIVTLGLQKLYTLSAPAELKRQARAGTAAPHAYEVSRSSEDLLLFLQLLSVIWASLLLFCAFKGLVWWAALSVSVLVLLGLFSWRSKRLLRVVANLSKPINPGLLAVVRYSRPLLKVLGRVLGRGDFSHSGLYEKQDLLELLQSQALQADNRINELELRIAWGALNFGDKLVRDIMVPRAEIDALQDDDEVGPILLDELHKSGHKRFPVLTGEPEEERVCGVLNLHELLGVKTGGKVTSHMNKHVFYVHEDFTLADALQAFVKTKQQLFIVVNEFEDLVGLITLEDILGQIVGTLISDEFDEYDSLKAVSKSRGKKAKADDDAIIIDETVVESEQL